MKSLSAKEDGTMKKAVQDMFGSALLIVGGWPVFANDAGGGYEGITAFYYATIGIVLAYGAWDIFFKKD